MNDSIKEVKKRGAFATPVQVNVVGIGTSHRVSDDLDANHIPVTPHKGGFRVKVKDLTAFRRHMVKKKQPGLIFRRYRRDPRTGTMLDARDYGLKAWPIRITEK